jgi:hypothetical protein
MVRLPVVSVLHTGHAESTFALIARQWRSGRMDAGGVLLKSAIGQPWLGRAVRISLHPLGVLGFWGAVLVAAIAGEGGVALAGAVAAYAALALAMVLRKRSVRDAALSIALWHVAAAGLLRGMLLSHLTPPGQAISSTVLREGPAGRPGN